MTFEDWIAATKPGYGADDGVLGPVAREAWNAATKAALELAVKRAETVDMSDETTAPALCSDSCVLELKYADGRRDAAASIRAVLEAMG